jgi:hypothetical protein
VNLVEGEAFQRNLTLAGRGVENHDALAPPSEARKLARASASQGDGRLEQSLDPRPLLGARH